jgi:hypothetical protein
MGAPTYRANFYLSGDFLASAALSDIEIAGQSDRPGGRRSQPLGKHARDQQ